MPAKTGFQLMLDEYHMSDDGDEWGNTRQWFYAVAEVMFHNQMDIPVNWDFEDSPMHADTEWTFSVEDPQTEILRELLQDDNVDELELRIFGDFLVRISRKLIKAGKDY